MTQSRAPHTLSTEMLRLRHVLNVVRHTFDIVRVLARPQASPPARDMAPRGAAHVDQPAVFEDELRVVDGELQFHGAIGPLDSSQTPCTYSANRR